MQKLVCDGCGKGELVSTPEKSKTIRPVIFNIVNDSRSTMPTGIDKYDGDLCSDCQFTLLSKYFNIRPTGKIEDELELPSFLEPIAFEMHIGV